MRLDFSLERNAFGKLLLRDADGRVHEGVLPVRAFPLSAPDGGVSIVDHDGHERVWIASLAQLPPAARALLEAELAAREFMPAITRIDSVSSFATPSTWRLQTDRGATQLVLKGEEDIRRLPEGRLLIADNHGLLFEIRDAKALDRHSRRLLDRFL